LIQVPYHAGDERAASSRGPSRLVEAGAAEALNAHGAPVGLEVVERTASFRDTAVSAAAVNRLLADAVRRAVAGGELPVVLSGSCNSALGVLAGFEHNHCGAVWLDAHADFNTPESTESGFLPGMTAAIVTGHCYRSYWASLGDATPLEEEAVAMFGVRALSPREEQERLERSAIRVVGWRDGKPEREPAAALDEVRRHVADVYLHVDFDAFSPDVAPGIADEPVPGGLTFEDAKSIVRGTTERFSIRAVTVATYAPQYDREDKTLTLGLRLLGLLGEYAANADRPSC
jgi:arginase